MLIIRAVDSLEFVDDVPSILFTLKPAAHDQECKLIQIASINILGFIAHQVAEAEPAQRRDFFHEINGCPWLLGLAGWLFEKFVHIRLTVHPRNQPLTTTPMKEDSPLVIPVCPDVVAPGGKDGLKDAIKQGSTFYWRPTSQNFTSFAAIICTPEAIILLQATVSNTSDINHDDLEAIYKTIPMQFGKCRKWCLVFITDTQEKADSLRNQSYLSPLKLGNQEELHVYSCVLDIGGSYLTLEEKDALERIIVCHPEE